MFDKKVQDQELLIARAMRDTQRSELQVALNRVVEGESVLKLLRDQAQVAHGGNERRHHTHACKSISAKFGAAIERSLPSTKLISHCLLNASPMAVPVSLKAARECLLRVLETLRILEM
jgi:hypothetical protein